MPDIPATGIAVVEINSSRIENVGFRRKNCSNIYAVTKDWAASAGPASGISYFEVYGIGSSNVGWEYPQYWQTTTSQNHGGSQLWIAVAQIGYGNVNQASLNGLFRSPFQIDAYCSSGGWHICNPGETIEAWMYYFAFDGQQQGLFSTSANSIASPFGYWSDSIYIQ